MKSCLRWLRRHWQGLVYVGLAIVLTIIGYNCHLPM
jgi:hypothetical protein